MEQNTEFDIEELPAPGENQVLMAYVARSVDRYWPEDHTPFDNWKAAMSFVEGHFSADATPEQYEEWGMDVPGEDAEWTRKEDGEIQYEWDDDMGVVEIREVHSENPTE